MKFEVVTSLEVVHIVHHFQEPAYIRIVATSDNGPFTIRNVKGLWSNRISKKVEEAEKLYSQLIGMSLGVIERHAPVRAGRPISVARVVAHHTLPAWARGDYEKVFKS